MSGGIFDKAVEAIKKGRRFLTVSHVSPEGDAVGSMLGMAMALRAAGKDVTAYLEDPVPDLFRFLPGADTVVHSLEGAGSFDVTIAVDCGQKERLGDGFVNLKEPGVVVNLDHHATNDSFGDINIIVPDASAAGELVYDLCKAANLPVTKDVAINLYVAIHTDTGSFRYSSSTPESFVKAGELVRLGADPWEVARKVYENHPARKFRLLAMVLATLDVLESGEGYPKIATLVVTKEMFRQAGAEKDLADGFVNYARGIEGVEVGALFRETGIDEYKVSLRSKGRVDVAEIASSFGGGGHRNAAGFSVKGSIEEVKARIVSVLREKLFGENV